MSDERQFDLFDERAAMTPQPTAALFPFPLSRRRKTIVRVAETLASRKTEEGQQSYWARIISDLGAELRRHGAGPAEVDRQLGAFHRAVSEEIARRQASTGTPRGAA
jgi:hypothetical protein